MSLQPMLMRAGVGWQYALTDLSLILFMVAASGLAKAPAAAKPQPVLIEPPALADAVAVWRPGAGAPSLDTWLTSQARDPRQRLTIIASYAGSDAAPASARAAQMLAQAGPSLGAVRILVEPGAIDDIAAALTWDVAAQPQAESGSNRQGTSP